MDFVVAGMGVCKGIAVRLESNISSASAMVFRTRLRPTSAFLIMKREFVHRVSEISLLRAKFHRMSCLY